ncbi:IucA/IucC family protein (plasmid) [Haloferax sp. S1W]|uniref:IucA/IucC family protein n=1 Tax=Haloferax sp. S1W TaxID=3377110 RepID=UPI0037C6D5A4
MNARAIAEAATIHAFLNCYLRETSAYLVRDSEQVAGDEFDTEYVIECPLSAHGGHIYAPLAYRSATGRHQFSLPLYYRPTGGECRTISYVTLVTLLSDELSNQRDRSGEQAELMDRVLDSCRRIERYVEFWDGKEASLYTPTPTFEQAEQALVFGHQLHPTPKSRGGMQPSEEPQYAPELSAACSLRYFRVDRDLAVQESVRQESAAEWVKSELRSDPTVSDEFVSEYVDSDDILIPIHPWQAEYLLDQPDVKQLLANGRLEDLGERGRAFAPTTSVRTLYHPDASFMVKGSLNVKITNSVRTNKRPELNRGIAVAELFESELGAIVAERFPDFSVIHDPAYLTVGTDDGHASGFEVILRENPFPRGRDESVLPVVSLCQDNRFGGESQLEGIIRSLAAREDRPVDEVSVDWFTRYLELVARPPLWLYLCHGIAVEAHQQNTVIRLDDGYPDEVYHRDNQGYYFADSMAEHVERFLPNLDARTGTVYPDHVADERFCYQLLVNNVFGVINAFGTAGLVSERKLLGTLRSELETVSEWDKPWSSLLTRALSESTVPSKANLLTRFHDLDEMADEFENQSVYVDIDNPLVTERAEVVR